MVNNVNSVKDGDIKSNIITLRSVYGKVGQKYYISPMKNPQTGRYPECVKRVDSHGDMILTEKEKEQEANGYIHFIPETQVFIITDGKTYNLDDIYQKAEWEAIKNCELIAPDRYAKNDKGDYLIDGTVDKHSTRPRYGVAELYVDRPGLDASRRVTRKKLINKAISFILDDERGYEGRLLVARVLGRNMTNLPNADVEDYLISIAEKQPDKIIDCYTGGDMQLRILLIQARENKVIIKKQGLYMYEETILGASDDAVVEWMKDPKHAKLLAMIRRDAYPDMFVNQEAIAEEPKITTKKGK